MVREGKGKELMALVCDMECRVVLEMELFTEDKLVMDGALSSESKEILALGLFTVVGKVMVFDWGWFTLEILIMFLAWSTGDNMVLVVT